MTTVALDTSAAIPFVVRSHSAISHCGDNAPGARSR